jgi:casein kinase II subunit beta
MGSQMLARAPIMAVMAILKILGKEWQFSMATWVGVLIIFVMVSIVVTFVIPKFKKIQKLTDNLNRITRENLTGIKFKNFLKILLSKKSPKESTTLTPDLIEELHEIRDIYGYIHKRFINSPMGMGLMREKFINGVFGYCPRILCNKQVLLPVGLSEDLRYSQVKVFCPLCQEVYKPRENLYHGNSEKKHFKFDLPDGIFFGTSFPQNFLMYFPDLDPRINNPTRYIPKLFGFRIFGKYGSKYYTENKEELKKNLIKYKIINS